MYNLAQKQLNLLISESSPGMIFWVMYQYYLLSQTPINHSGHQSCNEPNKSEFELDKAIIICITCGIVNWYLYSRNLIVMFRKQKYLGKLFLVLQSNSFLLHRNLLLAGSLSISRCVNKPNTVPKPSCSHYCLPLASPLFVAAIDLLS